MKHRQRRAWEARVMAGLTVAEVATALGRSRSTVHGWETGSTPRTPDDIVALCQLYGITTDWYLEGRGPMYRPQAAADAAEEQLQAGLGRLTEGQRMALAQLVQSMLP